MSEMLLELFSEEIPARMQKKAASDIKNLFLKQLNESGLSFLSIESFVTPRRLTLVVDGLSESTISSMEERKGPRVDAPMVAIEGFLRGTNKKISELERRKEKKGEFFYAVIKTPSFKAPLIISEIVQKLIRNFPWPKSMRWGNGTLRWVRPLKSILCIISNKEETKIVPIQINGLNASNETFGHSRMFPDKFQVVSFDDYKTKLASAKVLLNSEFRRHQISDQISNLLKGKKLSLVPDEKLLDEVTGLVEWPVSLLGRILPEFCSLPNEILQISMREHQKFFSLKNIETGLIEAFVTVANIDTLDRGALILSGNSKVLSARLADAKFFLDNDLAFIRKNGYDSFVQRLNQITFHNKIGNQLERVKRIKTLSRCLALELDANIDECETAAWFCKADLISEVVREFPALQGAMGQQYAIANGNSNVVAAACAEHYLPMGPSDPVPKNIVSIIVALADKIDTLASFWMINEKPTGSKDPYALRRMAIGAIRIILENSINISLRNILILGKYKFELDGLIEFFIERFRIHLIEKGFKSDQVAACLASENPDTLIFTYRKIEALSDFLKNPDSDNIVKVFKRVNNLLRGEEEKDGVSYTLETSRKFFKTKEEDILFRVLNSIDERIQIDMKIGNFSSALLELRELDQPITNFFDHVQINVDDKIVRRNRLCLMNEICVVMSKVALLSEVDVVP